MHTDNLRLYLPYESMERVEFWSAPELAAHEFPNPTFLVDPIIPLGGLVLLHGKRGVGKTQFCLSLANAIVNGRPFLNRFPTLKSRVLKVQIDMTAQIQQLRVQKVMPILHLDNLYYYFPRVLNIAAVDYESPAAIAIRRLEPALIIWDTLRKIHRENENSSESTQRVYSKVTALFPEATHLFVHHDRKTVVEQQALDPEEAFRGTGDWIDSTDTSMQLVDLRSANPGRVLLHFHKARTAPRHEKVPTILEMDSETMLMLPYSTVSTVHKALADLTCDDLLAYGICDRFRADLLCRKQWVEQTVLPFARAAK